MQITIKLTPKEQDAIEFLIKLRNMTEHKDAESFIRGLVDTAVKAALSEHKESERKAVTDELLGIDPEEVKAFLASRKLVA